MVLCELKEWTEVGMLFFRDCAAVYDLLDDCSTK